MKIARFATPGEDPRYGIVDERELIVADLAKRGFAVERNGGDGLRFESKLVIWNGAPSLGMTATDAGGVVRWSAMTDGSPARVPEGVAEKLDDFAARFGRH